VEALTKELEGLRGRVREVEEGKGRRGGAGFVKRGAGRCRGGTEEGERAGPVGF